MKTSYDYEEMIQELKEDVSVGTDIATLTQKIDNGEL